MFLASFVDNPFVTIIVLIVFFGLVALVVFLLRKYIPMFKAPEKKVDRATAAKEDLDRVLIPVEDEKTKAAMEKFNEDHKPEAK